MTNANSLDGVKKSETIARVVARCVATKTWRASCEREALAYVTKDERQAVLSYVRGQYDAAGAGDSGRWQ